jgi:hypothetical protein
VIGIQSIAEDDASRFWDKVSSTAKCWLWTAGRNEKGYGVYSVEGRTIRAHRYIWMKTTGKEIPEGLLVLHKCDIPSCVRPNHLFLGTAQENTEDALKKGRLKSHWRGDTDRHPRRKLAVNEQRQLLRLYRTGGYSAACLGAAYGVDVRYIYELKSRPKYAHLS